MSGEVLQDVGTQQRIRTIKKQAKYGGTPCDELRDGVQLIRCRAETPCSLKPNTITTEQPFFEYEGKRSFKNILIIAILMKNTEINSSIKMLN